MCGIIGYNGFREAKDVLIGGLKRLEYRGYDSAGIGIIDEKLEIFKEIGEISNIEEEIPNFMGNVGLGHTRWATHGVANDLNAHHHISQNNKISIVHNGIIENYSYLKKKLEQEGFNFKTETDSEVIALLIEKYYKDSFEDAFHKALFQLEGAYGIVAMCMDESDYLMVARKCSPLILGIGEGETFIASDVNAFLG